MRQDKLGTSPRISAPRENSGYILRGIPVMTSPIQTAFCRARSSTAADNTASAKRHDLGFPIINLRLHSNR
jgi:hypothetical protein